MTGPPDPPTSGSGITEVVPEALDGERVDRIVALLTGCSRSEAADLIRSGGVTVTGRVADKPSIRVSVDDVVVIEGDPRRPPLVVEPDPDMDVDVVYADADVIVVNKTPGVVVHPGPGQTGSTLVHGLLSRFPEIRDVGQAERPGLVHRLDRGTSGLMVVARNPEAHAALVEQLSTHSVERVYTALVWGHPDHARGVIDAPLGRSRRDPLRMTVAVDGRPSRTHYEVESEFDDPVTVSLVTCRLETGRTHQIRVHLSSIGHAVVGDPLYGGRRSSLAVDRPFLHARRLTFGHPGTGEDVTFDAPLPADLSAVLDRLS